MTTKKRVHFSWPICQGPRAQVTLSTTLFFLKKKGYKGGGRRRRGKIIINQLTN